MASPTHPVKWQTVSVFISSTFNDMHAERDYLVKQVFPELREWCERRKLRLVDIDLRWGVTEEDATRHKNVVKVCLDRINECRPFFLCFLGQRRGWVPGKQDISSETCEQYPDLKEYVGKASVTELEILHAVLNPFNHEEHADNAFFYLRDPGYLINLPADPSLIRKTYTNVGLSDPDERQIAEQELENWQKRVQTEYPGRFHLYQVNWNPDASTPELSLPMVCPSTNPDILNRWQETWKEAGIILSDNCCAIPSHLQAAADEVNRKITSGRLGNFTSEERLLKEVILDDLRTAISGKFPDHIEVTGESPLQKELDQQEQFLELNTIGYIERTGDFDRFDAYLSGGSQDLFVLTGKGGMGKTMLLANWIRKLQQNRERLKVFYRFVGGSDGSSTVDGILRSILTEMAAGGIFSSEIPDDPDKLRQEFSILLEDVKSYNKVVIVIDALNQLSTSLSNLFWLPRKFPVGISCVVSFKVGDEDAGKIAEEFRESLPDTCASIRPFDTLDERRKLVIAYLDQYLKKLDDIHIETLINSVGAENPLWLKVVLSELRLFGAFGNLGDKIRSDFGTSPVEAFHAVLQRLENDPAYSMLSSSEAVPFLFGFLSHARSGLSEEELVCLFRKENSIPEDDIRDSIRLILRQVRPFFAIRDGKFDFFYESFRLATVHRYEGIGVFQRNSKEWHRLLAEYFEGLPVWINKLPKVPVIRRAAELPYHLAWAGKADYLAKLFIESPLIESVVYGLDPNTAIEDLDLVLIPPVKPEQEITASHELRLIQGALRLSSHILVQDPSQFATQMFGRLLGFEEFEIFEFLDRVKEEQKESWLMPLNRCFVAPIGPLIITLDGHKSTVNSVVISPDGKTVISGSSDCSIRIWDLPSGECRHILMGHTKSVCSVAISPDVKTMISGSGDYSIRIWDIQKMKCKYVLEGHSGTINSVAISPDGKTAISGSSDKTIRVWDIDTGVCRNICKGNTGNINSVAIGPDGKTAVSDSSNNLIRIWDIDTGLCRNKLEGHTMWVNSVAISPNGETVASGSFDTTIRVWDTVSGSCLNILKGHTLSVETVTFCPNGKTVVSGSVDGTIKVWDINIQNYQTNIIWSLAVCPDGKTIFLGDVNYQIIVWDIIKNVCINILKGHTDDINTLAVSPDGKMLVSGSSDKTIRVWDLKNGHCMQVLRGHNQRIWAVAISTSGKTVISRSWDKTIRIWDLESGTHLIIPQSWNDTENSIAISSDDKTLISGSDDGSIKIWDILTGKILKVLRGHTGSVDTLAVSPDGKKIISGSSDNTIRVWDTVSGVCQKILKGHTRGIDTLAVSPDGKMLVSGSSDNTIIVWHLKKGKLILTIQMDKPIRTVCISPLLIIILERWGSVLFFSFEHFSNIIPIASIKNSNGILSTQCLHCSLFFEPDSNSLGKEIICPNCGGRLKLNPFVGEDMEIIQDNQQSAESHLDIL